MVLQRGDSMSDKLTIDKSWIIGDSHGQRYLGRLVEPKAAKDGASELVAWAPVERAKACDLFARAWALFPAYDFAVVRQALAGGQAGLASFVTPDCILSRGVPVWAVFTAARYIEDMHETDLADIRELVRSAEGYRTTLRTKRAGLAAG
jgi:hypothetical protein